MSEVTAVKQEVTEFADSVGDLDGPEDEDENPGGSAADEHMMQWALTTMRRTQYLSDSENEDEEKQVKSSVCVLSAKKKSASKNQVSWKNVGSVMLQLASPATQEASTSGDASVCTPSVDPLAIPIKEEPSLSPSAAAQNSEDPIAASPPVDPSAIAIKEEPPPSPLAAALDVEDPLGDSVFEVTKCCGGDAVRPKTECSTTPPPYADIDDFLQAVFDEPVQDPLGLESIKIEKDMPPALAECIITPSGVIQTKKEFTTAVFRDTTNIKAESDMDACTIDGKMSYDRRKEDEALRTEEPMEVNAGFEVEWDDAGVDNTVSCDAELQKEDDPLKTKEPMEVNGRFGSALAVQDEDHLPRGCISSRNVRELTDASLARGSETEFLMKVEALTRSGGLRMCDWDQFLAFLPPPRSLTTWTVQPSTPHEKALFRKQERRRFSKGEHVFTYRIHGYESVVGPVKMSCIATREGDVRVMNITLRSILCFLALVRDAVARLPNGIGSLEDIMELLSDSQFVKLSPPKRRFLSSNLTKMLAVLSLEDNPCLRYNAKKKMCVYLYRSMSEGEVEHLCQKQPQVPEASTAVESGRTKNVEKDPATLGPLRCVSPPARPPQGVALPVRTYPGKRMPQPRPVLPNRISSLLSTVSSSSSPLNQNSFIHSSILPISPAAFTGGKALSPTTFMVAKVLSPTTSASREVPPSSLLFSPSPVILPYGKKRRCSSPKHLKNGKRWKEVTLSEASVPEFTVSTAEEDCATGEEVAGHDTSVDSAVKNHTMKENTATDNRVKDNEVPCADFVNLSSSRTLKTEAVCAECYNYFASLLEHVNVPERGSVDEGTVGVSLEARNEVEEVDVVDVEATCSMCNNPTAKLGWVIVKYIVTWWAHQCCRCNQRYMDKRECSSHESRCRVGFKDSDDLPTKCVLCNGGDDAVNSVLFNMHMMCPVCGQLFTSYFNLGVFSSGNEVKRMNLNLKALSCFVCGFQVTGRKSLNAHMRIHR